ncbi:MAG: hypothetical protein KDB21_02835 [Acidimicrobiales bacterium]|nr:hypothetical protein [Acidimicrobiales bacterium]
MAPTTRLLSERSPAHLDEYLATGGGDGLTAARHRSPASLIELVRRSGLRGRGGAGFPTGRKWHTLGVPGRHPIIVVNAAEGEPGTFKDRHLLRQNPYLVLEGACIAAHAVASSEIVVAVKHSFSIELDRLRLALAEIAAAGWTSDLHVRVVEGPGEYLFGEETALLEVVDGRPPFPRVAPPYRRGLAGPSGSPTVLVDNVETLANLPGICRLGSEWYRSVGTDASPGTILCTVTGDTDRHGVGEFALGTPVREVLESLGGPLPEIGAVLSGVSNPPLAADRLDTPLTYEHLSAVGSGLGSAGFIVIRRDTDLRSVAAGVARFLAIESCGQCEPCKRDGLAIADDLASDLAGDPAGERGADVRDRLGTVARGARCALAGQTERVVGGLLDLAQAGESSPVAAPGELEVYPIVPLVDIAGNRAVLDLEHFDKRADWSVAPEEASALWPVQRLADRPVEVRSGQTAERPPAEQTHLAESAPTVDPGNDRRAVDIFAPLRLHAEVLERRCAALRHEPPARQPVALDVLHTEMDQYSRATQGLVYPLLDRLAPELGDDVTWYPERHEERARRIMERLEENVALSPRQIDEICADVHLATRELEERVLPLLGAALEARPRTARDLPGDLVELLDRKA